MNCSQLSSKEVMEEMGISLTQANALLVMVTGEAGAVFRRMSDDTQENYLWAVADLTRKAKEAYEVLLALDSAKGGKNV